MPGHWRSHPELADERRPDPLPPPLRAARRRPPAGAAGSRSTASSTRPTSGSTAPTSATRRATSSPTASTSRRSAALGDDHVLAVEVTCNPERGTPRPAQHHRAVPALRGRRPATGTRAACGARCSSTTPGRSSSTACACCAATPTRPAPTCACTPASTATPPAPCACARRPTATSSARPSTRSPPAPTRSSGRSTSTGPRLWWPRALGDQPLTDDRRRAARRRRGQRPPLPAHRAARGGVERLGVLDQRRAAVPQGRQPAADPARASPTPTPAEVRRDVELAVEAGLDALRVQAHIADHELYRAADELGVLLLQDFPLQWGYARQIRREAVRQAREAVNALGHHPSIVQWCAHDEPVADAPQVEADGARPAAAPVRRPAAADVEQVGARPLGQAGVRAGRPDPPDRRPRRRDPAPAPARRHRQPPVARLAPRRGRRARRAGPRSCPRLVRFVSEFGAQSVPDSADRVRRRVGAGRSSTGRRCASTTASRST